MEVGPVDRWRGEHGQKLGFVYCCLLFSYSQNFSIFYSVAGQYGRKATLLTFAILWLITLLKCVLAQAFVAKNPFGK